VVLIPAAILLPVSLIPVVHLDLQITPWIFEKIWNGPNGILWSLGETDSWTKPEENLVTLSLSNVTITVFRYWFRHCKTLVQWSDKFRSHWGASTPCCKVVRAKRLCGGVVGIKGCFYINCPTLHSFPVRSKTH
jgi:hypothetical protein